MFGNLYRSLLKRFVLKDPATCEHKWMVYGTAFNQGCLELYCSRCASTGAVMQPTQEEWGQAFGAHDDPYEWSDQSRVTIGNGQLL